MEYPVTSQKIIPCPGHSFEIKCLKEIYINYFIFFVFERPSLKTFLICSYLFANFSLIALINFVLIKRSVYSLETVANFLNFIQYP